MTDWLATGKQIREAQPFSVLLGAELVDFRESLCATAQGVARLGSADGD